jgi:Ulp1 family protease
LPLCINHHWTVIVAERRNLTITQYDSLRKFEDNGLSQVKDKRVRLGEEKNPLVLTGRSKDLY